MKKIVKIIEKSNEIKKRFFEKVNSQIKIIQDKKEKEHEGHHHHHDREDDELDDHNDPSNWSYA